MNWITVFLHGLGNWLEDSFSTLLFQKPLANLSKAIKNPVAVINAYMTTLVTLVALFFGILVAIIMKDVSGIIQIFWGFFTIIILCMILVGARLLVEYQMKEKTRHERKIAISQVDKTSE